MIDGLPQLDLFGLLAQPATRTDVWPIVAIQHVSPPSLTTTPSTATASSTTSTSIETTSPSAATTFELAPSTSDGALEKVGEWSGSIPTTPSPRSTTSEAQTTAKKRARRSAKETPKSKNVVPIEHGPSTMPPSFAPTLVTNPKSSVVAEWLADLAEKWTTWFAACVSPLFLGATRPGSSALPGAPQWMGCVRPIKSLLDMLRTPNEGAVMPHVYFIAPRGSTPVCGRCRAGGRPIRLSPIGYADEIAPEESPTIADDLLPMLRFPPVGRLPIVTGIKPPSHVVIYANYDITPDEAAEIAAIEAMEAMEAAVDQDAEATYRLDGR